MESLSSSVFFNPNLLYFALIAAAWIGVLALFIPGTGAIEILVTVGLLYSVGGLIYVGAGLPGMALLVASFVVYAVVILRQFSGAAGKLDHEIGPSLPGALLATAIQIGGGLLLILSLPELTWWLVVLLALMSLGVYRWMLLPTVSALRPPPQAGAEVLIGSQAKVRTPPREGKAGMIFLEGEYWKIYADETLVEGDLVDVIAREGMQLVVQKAVMPHRNAGSETGSGS